MKDIEKKLAEMSKAELKEYIRENRHEVGEYAKENGVFAYKIVCLFAGTLDSIAHCIEHLK